MDHGDRLFEVNSTNSFKNSICPLDFEIPSKPAEGDIHKYSANSIEKVKIGRGNERPLKIEIHMRAEVGFFQVEEVLIPKIQSSPAKSLLELYAGVEGEEMKRYM